ncbi:MAG: LysR substrate-binding domain-containing protein [Pseudomonadota bacterium]
MPPLRLLLAFAAVVRTGSVRAAAAELNVTQPAVSQAVKQLEAYCGLRLLDRSRRPAAPTDAGRLIAGAISTGLGAIEQALEEARRTATQGARTATIACSTGVATYWLMPRLGVFYDQYPDITVNVVTTQSGAPDLGQGIDLAIRFGHGRWGDGAVTHLFDEIVEPVCSPALLARLRGTPKLDNVSLLHVKSPETSWITWSEYLRAVGQPHAAGGGRTFTNYVQATQAALEGHGVMLSWRSITGALIASGHLVPFGLPELAAEDAFYIVARSKRQGESEEALRAWLVAQSKDTGDGPAFLTGHIPAPAD